MRLSTRVSASALCLVISMLLASAASAAVVGNQIVFGSVTTHTTRRAQPFVMPQSGRITSVTIYHGGAGTLTTPRRMMRLAVYEGTAAAPRILLGRTVNTAVNSGPGWQTIPLEGPVFAAGGSTVWLAWVFEVPTNVMYRDGSPGRVESQATFTGGMPFGFAASVAAPFQYSIYADYTPQPRETVGSIQWISSANLGVGFERALQGGTFFVTPMQSQDYKPAYSPDFKRFAIFRVFDYKNSSDFDNWVTAIVVMNNDGTNQREITNRGANHVPKWTRDGAHIVFSRNFGSGGKVWWTTPNASPGQEKLLSNFTGVSYEENSSALRDGRILVHRRVFDTTPSTNRLMAMRPREGGLSTYQEVKYAPNRKPSDPSTAPEDASRIVFSKMMVSPSGRRVTYMKMVGDLDYQRDSQIAYGDWDPDTLTVSNEVIIANPLAGTTTWYPCWTRQERFIIYTQKGVMLAYDLDTRATTALSMNPSIEYRYPNAVEVLK